jgi:hypothetical protein
MTPAKESSEGLPELLTLEPVIEAVRDGVEGAGWSMSGLQKTTSQELQGRWAGDTSRSAYLFFHRPDVFDDAAIDVYLDEGRRGLSGNLALVLEGKDLGDLGPIPSLLDSLSTYADARLPDRYKIPLTLRFRVDPRSPDAVDAAEPEVRFKVRIPQAAFRAGAGAVAGLAVLAVRSFEALLGEAGVEAFRLPPSE